MYEQSAKSIVVYVYMIEAVAERLVGRDSCVDTPPSIRRSSALPPSRGVRQARRLGSPAYCVCVVM